jgi:hypothetical protein
MSQRDGVSRRLRSQSGPFPTEPTLRGLAHRLERCKIKIVTVINRLEELDANHDGIVHISDLEDVLIDMLGSDAISKRELLHLSRCLQSTGFEDGTINYRRLHDVLEAPTTSSIPSSLSRHPGGREHWYDPEQANGRRAVLRSGSVGEWLQNASCPAELRNFKAFIALLEDFERESGMKCTPTEKGFVVPLGPDLRASITFTLP